MGLSATSFIQGTEKIQFPFNRCLRIGSVEAPEIWKLVIMSIFSELAVVWQEAGLGFTIDCIYDPCGRVWRKQVTITHFVWADNIYLVAGSLMMLKTMIDSVTAMLQDRGLYWKESSLRYMTNRVEAPASFALQTLSPDGGALPMVVKQVPHMEVLGARIDYKGSTKSAMDYRLDKAETATKKFAALYQLCCTAVGAGLGARTYGGGCMLGRERCWHGSSTSVRGKEKIDSSGGAIVSSWLDRGTAPWGTSLWQQGHSGKYISSPFARCGRAHGPWIMWCNGVVPGAMPCGGTRNPIYVWAVGLMLIQGGR